VETGQREGKSIEGEINDENAFVIDEFVTHAGLFGTAEQLSKTLFSLFHRFDLRAKFAHIPDQRFFWGWDRVEDPGKTLAGAGAPVDTVGHLGFTGTSFWVSPSRGKGYVLLTNSTQNDPQDKTIINQIRRELGQLYWKSL
jgi:CubicO group peptidase (beta-lactamase class C family)